MRTYIVAAACAVALLATPAAAEMACFGETSAGKNITTGSATDITGPVSLSADGLTGGLGFGCQWQLAEQAGFGTPVLGFLARYDWSDLSDAAGTGGLSSDGTWQAALTAGIKINPSVLAYGLVGVAGTSVSFKGLETDPEGLLMGAGLEIDVGVKNLSLIAEYDRINWDTSKFSAVRPDTDVFRVGVRYKFNFGGN